MLKRRQEISQPLAIISEILVGVKCLFSILQLLVKEGLMFLVPTVKDFSHQKSTKDHD